MGKMSDLDITLREIAEIVHQIGTRHRDSIGSCKAILDRLNSIVPDLDPELWEMREEPCLYVAICGDFWASSYDLKTSRKNCLALGASKHHKMLIFRMPEGAKVNHVSYRGAIDWTDSGKTGERPHLVRKYFNGEEVKEEH